MKKASRISEIAFFMGYALIIFSDMYNYIPWLQSILTIVDVVAVLALTVSFLVGAFSGRIRMSWFAIVGMSIFTALVAVTAISSDIRTLLKLPFLFLAFMNVKFDKVISFDLKCRLLLTLVIMALSIVGLNGNTVLEYRNGLMRNSFGAGHPNAIAFEWSVICADLFYLVGYKKTKKVNARMAVLFAIGVFIFNFFLIGSRTNLIFMVLLTAVFVFKDRFRIKSCVGKAIIRNMFIVCFLVSFLGVVVYRLGLPISYTLDKILSRRLEYESFAIREYGITFFGNNIKGVLVDNAYLGMLLRYGILLTACMGFMYYATIKKLTESSKYKLLLLIFVVFMFYGLSETPIYSPGKNPFVLLLVCSFVQMKGLLPEHAGIPKKIGEK